MKKIILFLSVILCSFGLFAADTDLFKACPPKARQMIDAAEKLVTQKQYESAFETLVPVLTGSDNKDDYYAGGDYVLFQKVEYAINYFAQSMMHKMFAFKNFEKGDTFQSVRTSSNASFNLVMFDPEELVESYAKVKGMTPILHLALAEYYYDVNLRYPDQWLISSEELRKKAAENYKTAFDAGFYNIETLGNYGLNLLYQHDLVQAQKVFTKLLKLDPENPNGWYNLAISFFYNKDYDKAIEAFKSTIKYPEENIDYRYDARKIMAECYLRSGKNQEAVKTLQDAKKDFPDYYMANITLARYLLINKDFDGALREFEEAYESNHENADVVYNIIDTYMSLNMNDKALEFCEMELPKTAEKEYLAKAYLNFYIAHLYALKAKNNVDYKESAKKAKSAFAQVEPNFKKAKFSDYKEYYNQLKDLINSL